jgi:eukaryotic-like serine/threonine-protein kinase
MGEVYRARDSKLNRDVAIKVLPASLASDAERIARFSREAQVLAALNHPNIAHIHGFEDSTGVPALVMELVEGPTLAERIARGPIPIDETLAIARQIAEALEAAHERGIVHRDLKPANIKLTADGNVKVLDFGLAKAIEPASGMRMDLANSPTITSPAMMTGIGMILGTAAYMAPEQAKGRPADKRSDVWAFGCVLYEMLTGKRAFGGEDVSDTLAAVLRGEPDWIALPPDLSSTIRTIITRCLAKDRKHRFADTSVALFLLSEPPEAMAPVTQPVASPRPLSRRALPLAASAIAAAAIAGAVAWARWPSAPAPLVTRFAVPLGEGQKFTNDGRQLVAVSPDGTRIVYVANTRLYLRALSGSEAIPIAGTESVGTTNPVFSPDGRSIAFYTSGALKKISISGGTAVTICPAANPFGMSWDHDEILFGQGTAGIMRVSANGATPERLVAVKTGELAHGPQLLPGGQAVLFTLATEAIGRPETWDRAQIVVQSLRSGERKTLVSGGADARYVPTGHLVYALSGVVFAVRFDLRRLAVIGGPVPIVEGVARAGAAQTGTAHFASSDNGSLMFIPGPVSTSAVQEDVALMDRQGAVEPLKLPPDPYEDPRVSPDGTRVAVATYDGKAANIWIYDLSRTSARRQLTFGGRNRFPLWSADSQRVAFQSDREGDLALFWQRADGAGTAERLTKPEQGTAHFPESWAPDGKTLLVTVSKGSSFSLWAFSMPSQQGAAYGGVEAPGPITAAFSPDGRWVAYAYLPEGTFVQPFPATGAIYRIYGGLHPFWSPDGHELFFNPRGEFAVSRITTKPSFIFASPTQLPTGNLVSSGLTAERNIDTTPDGKRFVGVIAARQVQSNLVSSPQIRVVENWFEELKAKVPTK